MKELQSIKNFLSLSDNLGTAGQPTKEQFENIKESGYEVVVNLALSNSPNAIPDEQKLVEGLGLQYIHIPVVWDSPKVDDIKQFFEVMDALQNRKIFVHCGANMRVSVFMYLYRLLRQGMEESKALQDLYRIWHPNDIWQEFINKVQKENPRAP